MPEPQRLPDVLDERLFDILERLHAAGSVMAIYEALAHCREHDVQVPDWAIAGVLRVLKDSVSGGLPKPPGRAAVGFARERQDLIHFLRWDLVHELMRTRGIWTEQLEAGEWHDRFPDVEHRKRLKSGLRRIGKNKEELFECASQFSEGTLIAAGADTFKANFRRVEDDMRSPGTSRKYYLFDFRTLNAFELSSLVALTPVNKFMEFFHSES